MLVLPMNVNPGHPSSVPIALCLGGLDPSGGAGLLRDVQVLSSMGIYPMALCTAETIQNGSACIRIASPRLSPAEGFQALLPHLTGIWGVKLGLCALRSAPLRDLIQAITKAGPQIRIWDPIKAPTSGVGLHGRAGLLRMAQTILPTGGWTVSPNRCEAQAILGTPASDPETLARPWLEMGAEAVWLKGGHTAGDEVQDVWITQEGALPLEAHPRLPGERRGTGCSLASAWLGMRLKGAGATKAASQAVEWLRAHWSQAEAPGNFGRPAFLPELP
ncbi:bifunctional hydroxymethylpyrimidine kinase/phosphomethylpyrimidine kinase [Holophaga foetida]|uniref:bifunctional hydroxymethylpyrimidine kinase/phosphomethylpyrimidine kinase n=1 Tax=Holophaga foetida TaxID=35839 RepID=UPI0002474A4B|nr:bifunctional hydroxymethylpyrimidine kinase/phosphomethylpyrimidine kinase [Holophaga foetida]